MQSKHHKKSIYNFFKAESEIRQYLTSLGNDLEANKRVIGNEAISPQSKGAWTLAQSGAHAHTSSAAGMEFLNCKSAFILTPWISERLIGQRFYR